MPTGTMQAGPTGSEPARWKGAAVAHALPSAAGASRRTLSALDNLRIETARLSPVLAADAVVALLIREHVIVA